MQRESGKSTVLVNVSVDDNHIGAYRALCDTGSHLNIVTYQIGKHFIEKAEQMNSTISGIANESIIVQRKIGLEIRAWFDSNKKVTFCFEGSH